MSIAATFPRICEESERETVHGHGRVLPCWQGMMMMMLMVGGAMKSSFCWYRRGTPERTNSLWENFRKREGKRRVSEWASNQEDRKDTLFSLVDNVLRGASAKWLGGLILFNLQIKELDRTDDFPRASVAANCVAYLWIIITRDSQPVAVAVQLITRSLAECPTQFDCKNCN